MKYLFSYDIKNSKRSAKIRKKFEQLGYSVQKSIYTFSISDSEADSLTAEILSILNIKEDRLAVYRICERCALNGYYINCSVSDFFKEGFIIL